MSSKHKLRKPFIIFAIILLFFALTIIFISPISKYLVEKYDTKFTGREITMDYAYVNPLTGYIYFNNFKVYELKSDSIFLSTDGVSGDFAMWKLFSKTYEISELVLNNPQGSIIQDGNNHDLNFMDIVKKFSPKKTEKVKSLVHFSILKIKIKDGVFHYFENVIPVKYFIKNVNIESTGYQWNNDTIALKFSFLSGIGKGDIKGNITINSKTLDYRLDVIANKFDLKVMEQYLTDITNYGSFAANLDADIKATGNFKDRQNVIAKGMLAFSDFHFGKNPKEDYASFDKLVFMVNELSPKYHKYSFDSISLIHPYFKYEKYDHLDNMQTMFGKKGSKVMAAKDNPEKFNLVIEIARYVKMLAHNFFRSNYQVNRLGIYNGDFKFNDFSRNEKFTAEFTPLNFVADSIDRKYKQVNAYFKSDIKPYGSALIKLSINPKDSSDFEINYKIQKLSAAMFNPYLISLTSFPLDRGTIEIHGNWHVSKGNIQSTNHLVVIDPRLQNRIKNKGTNWIPMRILMFFVRERGNVIDYEIPITGNLKDPKFHWKDVIVDALINVFVKPATVPYRTEVKNVETEIEKTLSLKWDMRHSTLQSNQEKFINKMADFLKENPKEHITIHPQLYALKEKEYILLFESKKKYYLHANNKNAQSFNDEDEEIVDKMSIKDSLFIHYLNKQVSDQMIFTVQEKCAKLLGPSIINEKLTELKKERLNIFMQYFKEKGVEKQIKIYDSQNVIPYNGFSFYKIAYNNEFPEYLIEAHQKMNELNNEEPRKKFKKEREKNKKNL
jgi:hypothetical protein